MKYGVVIFATDYTIRPDELAKAAEERGFEAYPLYSILRGHSVAYTSDWVVTR